MLVVQGIGDGLNVFEDEVRVVAELAQRLHSEGRRNYEKHKMGKVYIYFSKTAYFELIG